MVRGGRRSELLRLDWRHVDLDRRFITFASRLVQQGVSLYEVMHLTGHKSLEMVQRYAHLAPDFQRRAIDALNSYGTNLAQSDQIELEKGA